MALKELMMKWRKKLRKLNKKLLKYQKLKREYIEYKNGQKLEIEENDDIADEEDTMHDEIEKNNSN